MKILLSLFFFFLTGSLSAREMYSEKPAKFITSFHFKQLSGGVILLKAHFNNISDTFNFILDTGSGGISLDSTTTEMYQIPHVPSGRYIYGIAGVRKVDFAQHNRLSFPGITIDSLDFYINNYEVLSSVYGIRIDGIIGYSFLSRYIVKVNFDSLTISIFQPGFLRYPEHGFLLRPQFRGLPIIPLRIKDSKTVNSKYFFDTGAGLCFLLSKQFKDDSAVLLKKRKPLPIEVQGLGGKRRMQLTVIKELQIGSYKFRKVPTYILDDEFNVLSYPTLGGLIGNDILRRFNLIINYPQREIHLLPNGHFRDPFDYSYTGMTMYNLDGEILIDDIIEGSPADKSGLKNGDIIMAVNNNFSGNLETYKNLLQKTGTKIEVLVMRNKIPKIISLKVGRIH
ncbi:MAG TPA: aspartyl protease family protein [Hanamia sp.]|nr:aspartyl protease family protein [Hanamia sp.]